MARWCPQCNRPKELHALTTEIVDTLTGTTTLRQRLCLTTVVDDSREGQPIRRADDKAYAKVAKKRKKKRSA